MNLNELQEFMSTAYRQCLNHNYLKGTAMENEKIQRIIDVTYHRLSTKFGNDLQTLHDTVKAEVRRTLGSVVHLLRQEIEQELRKEKKSKSAKEKTE